MWITESWHTSVIIPTSITTHTFTQTLRPHYSPGFLIKYSNKKLKGRRNVNANNLRVYVLPVHVPRDETGDKDMKMSHGKIHFSKK